MEKSRVMVGPIITSLAAEVTAERSANRNLALNLVQELGTGHSNNDFSRRKTMSKKLIFGIAFSLVLVSGGFFSAQANCGGGCLSSVSPCNWRLPSFCGFHLPSCLSFHCDSKDLDRTEANREGAYSSRPITPDVMGAVL